MAQRYRTERDGNIDPGYWNPDIGGRQGQRDAGPAGEDWRQRRAERGDSGSYSQAYDENAESWRRAGYGNRGGADERRQASPPDLEYDQGWHSNAEWSGEGDAVPLQGRGMRHRRRGADSARESNRESTRESARRGRADDEGNYLGQGWNEASGSSRADAEAWDRNSDLFARGGTRGYGAPSGENRRGENRRGENRRDDDRSRGERNQGERYAGARGTEGRDWRGAQQTTGREYFSPDEYRRDYGGFVAPEHALGYSDNDYTRGRRTSPYSGSSAGYVTGEAFGDESWGDESWSGNFIGGTGRDYERDARQGDSQRGPDHRRPDHRGKGPKGYARSAERIRDEVCERLTEDDLVDAREISISCREGGVLVLEGTVDSMRAKHRAELIADRCNGVREVDSRLKVLRPESQGANAMQSGAGMTGGSESGSAGRQEQGKQDQGKQDQGQQGSRTASSASMMAAARDAGQERQKH
jgi:hypothetical protein